MFRWHQQTCRKPDIAIVDDLLFCCSCDSAAESPSLQLYQHSDLATTSTSDSPRSLNLRWPLSVQYMTDGERNTTNEDVNLKARLQQPSVNEGEPSACSQLNGRLYPPLAQKYDMRLLRLSTLPSSGHLHAELELVDLIYCPVFEALSYTWAGETGSNAKSRFIFIGPYWDMIPITINCDLALRLLLEKGHLSIWVDSVCINQQDPHERSRQVAIMREIYSKASQVLVYLGPSANHSDDAMDALLSLSQTKVDDPELQLNSTQIFGLTNLFERRYFFRIWVIQEIAMARGITLYCGKMGVSYASFSSMRAPYHYIREVSWLLQHIKGGGLP
ncbi:heterokaryon incompatibility protein-domain-containing protein [Annulohypoxylon bovei var. microspora]|nr:heterokaryon incompatibility protein-domain-containing protein [Annulohypoxylon bovei var. microspora]